jgi:hypothetical protein
MVQNQVTVSLNWGRTGDANIHFTEKQIEEEAITIYA